MPSLISPQTQEIVFDASHAPFVQYYCKFYALDLNKNRLHYHLTVVAFQMIRAIFAQNRIMASSHNSAFMQKLRLRISLVFLLARFTSCLMSRFYSH